MATTAAPAPAPAPVPAGGSKFHYILSAAGRSFLRAFLGSLLVLAPGVGDAPNLNRAYALGVSALIASVTAGINTLQEFVPQITWGQLLGEYGKIADSFTRVFLGTLIATLPPILNAPDLSAARALGTAALIGAITAGLRAVQGFFTKGDVPNPQQGT
jgi:hypothetical protein